MKAKYDAKSMQEFKAQLNRINNVYKDHIPMEIRQKKSGELALMLSGEEVRSYQKPEALFNDAILLTIGYHSAVTREREPHTKNRDHLTEQMRRGVTTLEQGPITKAEQEEVLKDEEEADIKATLNAEAEKDAADAELSMHPEYGAELSYEEGR